MTVVIAIHLIFIEYLMAAFDCVETPYSVLVCIYSSVDSNFHDSTNKVMVTLTVRIRHASFSFFPRFAHTEIRVMLFLLSTSLK